MTNRYIILIGIVFTIPFFICTAEEKSTVINVRKMKKAPIIDGITGQEEWKDAAHISKFTLFSSQKANISIPTEQTEAWFGYDDDNLYIAFKCDESKSASIMAKEKNRDGKLDHDDSVEIYLNTAPDELNYYHFMVNSSGIRYDAFVKGNCANIVPWSNDDWRVVSSRNRTNWTTEIIIPFRILRIGSAKNWRINLMRNNILPQREYYSWAPIKSISGWHQPKQFGYLYGLDIPEYNAITVSKLKLLKESNLGSNFVSITLKNTTQTRKRIKIELKLRNKNGKSESNKKEFAISAKTEKNIELPFYISEPGNYYYNLTLMSANNNKVFYSFSGNLSVQLFTIELPVAVYDKEAIVSTVRYCISPDVLKNYQLKIDILGELQKNISSTLLSANSKNKIILPKLKPGYYSFRFQLIDKNRNTIASSVKFLWVIKHFLQPLALKSQGGN
ncbi:MAG: sugar-binding protein [Victivallaceae bacterium]